MFFFGRKLSKSAVNGVCVGMVVLAFAVGLPRGLAVHRILGRASRQAFREDPVHLAGNRHRRRSAIRRTTARPQFRADAGFLLDPLSSIWLLFVTGVGMLIHIYSMGYMAHEGGYYRFFGYLNLFMFSMLTLILANNYALMFVGWEGVGLCSYLLIGFYFQRHSASTAANKAFIVNRVGDAGFLLGMLTIAWYFGSVQYTAINHLARSGQFLIGDPVITAACLLLFVGACGKSAQFPLYVWLPDAMEGPTPVSALIHAATMVTAGVYMVARSNALFVLAPNAMKTVAIVGALTAIFAASIGAGAERHQARAGVLDGFAAGLHVPGARRRRICRRRLPRLHPRVLQGAALPRSRLGDSRHGRRAGDAAHGRAAQERSRPPSAPC